MAEECHITIVFSGKRSASAGISCYAATYYRGKENAAQFYTYILR
jgi:hypothetical protein